MALTRHAVDATIKKCFVRLRSCLPVEVELWLNDGINDFTYCSGKNGAVAADPLVARTPPPLAAEEIQIAAQQPMLDSDPTQEMRDNPEISKFLDQLGGSMTKRQYKEPHWKDPIKRTKSHQQKQITSQRIALHSLRSLLEDSRSTKHQREGQLDVATLAAGYEVDPNLLAKVLQFNAVPVYREEEDGRIIGSWPGS